MTKKFQITEQSCFSVPPEMRWGVLESLGSLVFLHPAGPQSRGMMGHVPQPSAWAFLTVSPPGVRCGGRPKGALQNTEVPNLRYYRSVPVGSHNLGLWLVELGSFRGVLDWIHPVLSLCDSSRTLPPFFYMRELSPYGKLFPRKELNESIIQRWPPPAQIWRERNPKSQPCPLYPDAPSLLIHIPNLA